jgi:hypothetical protein
MKDSSLLKCDQFVIREERLVKETNLYSLLNRPNYGHHNNNKAIETWGNAPQGTLGEPTKSQDSAHKYMAQTKALQSQQLEYVYDKLWWL